MQHRIYLSLRAQPIALFGLALCVTYIGIALLAPLIAPYAYQAMDANLILEAPSWQHPFGTDEFGRDVLSRVLYGTPISLKIGLLVVFIASTTGSLIGMIGGFFGGWIDEVAMRITDVFLSVPALVLALTISVALGPGINNAIIGIAIVRWTLYARLMRSSVLVERNKEYVLAATALGASKRRILFRHILPNSYGPILVQATLDFGIAILLAAGLSFIGAGAQPPSPEWGSMVARGRQYILGAWWIATFPGFAIFGAVLGFNLLGDGLRDALDPRLHTQR